MSFHSSTPLAGCPSHTLYTLDMRRHFVTEQWLPYPIETVFAFFADPTNLPRLMPDWQQARIVQKTYVPPPPPPAAFPGSDTINAGNGTRLTITIRPIPFFPLRIPWDALIEDFRWLQGFCDIQLRGPFRYWRHCHTVQPERGGTRLLDDVTYELPFGHLGALADVVFVRRQLSASFRFRHRRTIELLALAVGNAE